MFKKACPESFRRVCPVLSRVEGKAAAILTSGAYMEYVSTAKWRERRWRLFSTFPVGGRGPMNKKPSDEN